MHHKICVIAWNLIRKRWYFKFLAAVSCLPYQLMISCKVWNILADSLRNATHEKKWLFGTMFVIIFLSIHWSFLSEVVDFWFHFLFLTHSAHHSSVVFFSAAHSFVCQFDDEPFIAAGESAAALPLAPIQKKIVTENLRILIYCLTSDGAWRAAARALSYALSRALLCSRRRQTNHLRQWQKWPDHTKKSRIIKSCCVLI